LRIAELAPISKGRKVAIDIENTPITKIAAIVILADFFMIC